MESDLVGSSPSRKRRYPVAKIKGGWTPVEDDCLKQLVDQYQEGNWSVIARALNALLGKPEASGRIGKQCRERWNHHLKPGIRTDAWQEDEEALLVQAHENFGNRWSDIARCIPGRTENAIKNHWNATLRRKETPASRSLAAKAGTPTTVTLKTYMQRINLLPFDDGSDFDSHHHQLPQLPQLLPPEAPTALPVAAPLPSSNPCGSSDSPAHSSFRMPTSREPRPTSPAKRLRLHPLCDQDGPDTPPVSSGSATSSTSYTLMNSDNDEDRALVAPVKRRRSGRTIVFSGARATSILQHIKPQPISDAWPGASSHASGASAQLTTCSSEPTTKPEHLHALLQPVYPAYATTIFSLGCGAGHALEASQGLQAHSLSHGSSNRLDSVGAAAEEDPEIQAAEIMLALHATQNFAKPAAPPPEMALALPAMPRLSLPPLPPQCYLGPSIGTMH